MGGKYYHDWSENVRKKELPRKIYLLAKEKLSIIENVLKKYFPYD